MVSKNPTTRGLSFKGGGGSGGSGGDLRALKPIVSDGTVGPFNLIDKVTNVAIDGSVYEVQVGDVPQNSELWTQTTATTITFDFASETGTIITGTYTKA